MVWGAKHFLNGHHCVVYMGHSPLKSIPTSFWEVGLVEPSELGLELKYMGQGGQMPMLMPCFRPQWVG